MLLALKGSESGVAGSRLSTTARQNLTLARALIKKPEILVVNDGLSVYEETEQLKIKDNIRDLLPNTAILWLVSELENTRAFDRVVVPNGN
jgi:ABC-type multidrug transport system fused ATPase/permease subunit